LKGLVEVGKHEREGRRKRKEKGAGLRKKRRGLKKVEKKK